MSNIFETESASLQHHGILGQKWGVRRFENKNGHLTPAGLKRYEDGRKVTEKEKHAFSIKAAGHKALANVYGMNAKVYSKSNKTLSSMNKAAKTEQLKKAEQAQKEADAKKAEKGTDKGDKKGLSDKQKKMIIAGAAVTGAALAAYGGYKLYQLNQQKSDKLGSQKKLESVKKQYTIDRAKWERGDQSTPPPLPTSHSKAGMAATNKLASEAGSLARSITAEGPKSFSKTTQNGPTKEQMTQQKLKAAQESRPKIDRATVSHTPIDRIQIDRATVDRIKVDRTPINMDSFNKAAQANDDLVNSLLKKNAKNLGL